MAICCNGLFTEGQSKWCSWQIPGICPEGTCENSPAFQRWDGRRTPPSPKGTVERPRSVEPIQSSLRDSYAGSHVPGVETPGYCQESLRDRAGTHLHKSYRKASGLETYRRTFSCLRLVLFLFFAAEAAALEPWFIRWRAMISKVRSLSL